MHDHALANKIKRANALGYQNYMSIMVINITYMYTRWYKMARLARFTIHVILITAATFVFGKYTL